MIEEPFVGSRKQVQNTSRGYGIDDEDEADEEEEDDIPKNLSGGRT